MENITPNVLKQIEESLEANLRDILGGNQDVGGPKVVADILNLTGSSVEKSVLEQMDSADPEIAEEVRNMMFVFGDLVKLTDKELQVLLKEVEQKDLVVALKGADEELRDKVLGNMSERVRQFILEEMEFLGPTRLSEVEEVQLRIVQLCRQLEDQGQIVITRGDASQTMVWKDDGIESDGAVVSPTHEHPPARHTAPQALPARDRVGRAPTSEFRQGSAA